MEKPLKETIAADLKAALKQKDTRKVSVLRMINAEIKNLEIEMRKDAVDADVLKVLNSGAKKETGASSAADFGKAMKTLMPKIQGRANGQIVSQKLKEKLG